jgi:hypothetical protein
MYSMTLASLGWGCWWLALLLRRVAPGFAPGFLLTGWAAGVLAALGLLAALLTVRATKAWLLFSAVAIFANAALLFLPWTVPELYE